MSHFFTKAVSAVLAAFPIATAVALTPALAAAAPAASLQSGEIAAGVVRIESRRDVDETVRLIRASVESKGIRLFDVIDQSTLGQAAGVPVGQSTLVLFGNPPLGLQFLQANPYAGLDWPVRMLVSKDADGRVWIAWTDFEFIARRYRLTGLDAQIKKAAEVAATIAAEAAG